MKRKYETKLLIQSSVKYFQIKSKVFWIMIIFEFSKKY